MKTGKKILALLLVFCFMMVATVPAFAASFSHTLTNHVDNALWGRWDSTASITDLDVTIKISSGAISLTFADEEIAKLLKDKSAGDSGYLAAKGYYVTLPDITFGEGENTITVPGGKFKFNTVYGLWVTTYLPTSGAVAKAMVEDSKTDADLQALMIMDETTGAASLATGNSVYGKNIYNYIMYKAGQEPEASAKATVHAGGNFQANGDFPLTSFFIADDKISTFVDEDCKGSYVLNNSTAVGLYAAKTMNSMLDGPYTVFTAPDTGIYDVFVAKRDTSASANNATKSQRHIELEIAGEVFQFSNTKASTTMGYYWEPAAANKALSLTKGQQVPVRILAETGHYGGAYGVAFAPRTDAETPVEIQYNASPLGDDVLNNASIATSVPEAQTVTVNVSGEELAVTAGTAHGYYPNASIAKTDGSYNNQPTLLDALVAADKLEDIGIDPHVLLADGTLYSGTIDTMAITPDTAVSQGLNWPTGSNALYADLWTGNEILQTPTGTTAYSMLVKIPENGTYHFIVSGSCWDSNRYVTAQVGGQNFEADDTGYTKFILGAKGKNEYYHAQSANGIELTAGYHLFKVTVTGVVRMSYAGLVKADSQEDAASIQEGFKSKADFNDYMNSGTRNVFFGGKIADTIVSVNGETINGGFDRYILSEGDEILLNTFEPVSLGQTVTALSSNITYDSNRHLSDETFANTDFVILLSNYANMPVDVTKKDSMRGLYLNGYVTYTSDNTGTDGDDTQVINYIHYPILGNSIDGSGRLVIAININDASNTVFDGKTYKNLIGGFHSEYEKNTDCSNLYVSDERFNGDATVTAEYADGKVVISSKKAQPIFVIVKNADGSKASATNYALGVAPVEVPVTAGQTVYVWGGTPYKTSGTTALPLCAPVTVPAAE